MKNQLEQYFGCKVKIAEYKNKLPLPIFMTMRDIMMVEIYGVSFAIIDVLMISSGMTNHPYGSDHSTRPERYLGQIPTNRW